MRAARPGPAWIRAAAVAIGLAAVAGACSKSGPGSNTANGATNGAVESEVPTRITTPARPPATAATATGLAHLVTVGQRARIGEWEVLVSGPWTDGDGKVVDPVKGPDSYGPDKKFVLVPVEVSRVSGPAQTLTTGDNVLMTFATVDPAAPQPGDFATNCPYDESWPNKVDLWKEPVASGETLRGNACFIVPAVRTGEFVLGVAPFGQRTGTETYFATH